jgi:DNA polymerase II small subunit/DNA polymerase delta subunit B
MEKLEEVIAKLGLGEDEAINVLRQLNRPQRKVNFVKHHWHPRHIKLGIISDTHIGSKYFNPFVFDDAVKAFTREKVDAIYHAGDVIEGMSNRDGHIYELECVGTSAQVERASELLRQFRQPLFFTTGNHDEWSRNKANQGILVGKLIEERVPNSV